MVEPQARVCPACGIALSRESQTENAELGGWEVVPRW